MLNLRIAASIVLLASSAYLMLHVLSPVAHSNKQPAALTPHLMVAPRGTMVLPQTPPAPGSAHAQQPTDLPALPKMPPPTSIAAVRPNARMAEAKKEELSGMANGAAAYVDTVETAPAKSDTVTIVNAAPAAAPLAAPPPPPPVAVAEATRSRDAAASGSSAPERIFVKASPDAAPVRNFVAIQQAIARGETPRDIDAFAIVQHFAAPERRPAGLHLELEASAAPLDATKWILRVSVDGTAGIPIDLTFGDAVISHRSVTGSPAPNETALYEIEIKPDAQPDQTIARLRAGKSEAAIRVADLHKWNDASPRMKRASLAAAWARTAQSGAETGAIVAKARAAHIDELADMAERAERIR
jgi:hypothetical protein